MARPKVSDRVHFSTTLNRETLAKLEAFKYKSTRKIKSINIILEYLVDEFLQDIAPEDVLLYENAGKSISKPVNTQRNLQPSSNNEPLQKQDNMVQQKEIPSFNSLLKI